MESRQTRWAGPRVTGLLYLRAERLTHGLRRCRLAPAVRGTLSPDTPSQRPKGLWKPVIKTMDRTAGLLVLLVILAAALSWNTPANGQEAGRPANGQDTGWVEQAERAFEAGDFELAARWYRAGADQGATEAQAQLGWLYRMGLGVREDYSEARRWFLAAAQAGHAGAEYGLGTLFEHGRGVPQDLREAARWYYSAALKGNAMAQNNLGWAFQNGRGVERDYKAASEWYRLAADQGQPDAIGNLGLLHIHGLGVKPDFEKGLSLLREAAEQGDQEAAALLRQIEGPGGPGSPSPAAPVTMTAAPTTAAPASPGPFRPTPSPPAAKPATPSTPPATPAPLATTPTPKPGPSPTPAPSRPMPRPAPPVDVALPPATPRDSTPPTPKADATKPLSILGRWRSTEPVVDVGLRRMFLGLGIARDDVTFFYECHYLDGTVVSGKFSTPAVVGERELRILEAGAGNADANDKRCSASIKPVAIAYRLDREADGPPRLSVTIGQRALIMRRLSTK